MNNHTIAYVGNGKLCIDDIINNATSQYIGCTDYLFRDYFVNYDDRRACLIVKKPKSKVKDKFIKSAIISSTRSGAMSYGNAIFKEGAILDIFLESLEAVKNRYVVVLDRKKPMISYYLINIVRDIEFIPDSFLEKFVSRDISIPSILSIMSIYFSETRNKLVASRKNIGSNFIYPIKTFSISMMSFPVLSTGVRYDLNEVVRVKHLSARDIDSIFDYISSNKFTRLLNVSDFNLLYSHEEIINRLRRVKK